MPCEDITEILELELDRNGCLQAFSLHKQTCGIPVGDDLILPHLRGIDAETIARSTLHTLIPNTATAKRNEQFLFAKQWSALHSAIEAYLGHRPSGPGTAFALEAITYHGENVSLRGLVRIDLLTDKIAACKGCKRQRDPSAQPVKQHAKQPDTHLLSA